MSVTRMVPASVPSLFQSSWPFVPSLAEKYRVPPTAVRLPGEELAAPGLMSLTMTVPATVPSLFHSSWPLVASLARKYSTAPTAVRFPRVELPEPGSKSLSMIVPAAVPSVFHSSVPSSPVPSAAKKVVPPMVTKESGYEETSAPLVLMSRTRYGVRPARAVPGPSRTPMVPATASIRVARATVVHNVVRFIALPSIKGCGADSVRPSACAAACAFACTRARITARSNTGERCCRSCHWTSRSSHRPKGSRAQATWTRPRQPSTPNSPTPWPYHLRSCRCASRHRVR